jgi:predicted Holliday junction resolvase-like endonuclease
MIILLFVIVAIAAIIVIHIISRIRIAKSSNRNCCLEKQLNKKYVARKYSRTYRKFFTKIGRMQYKLQLQKPLKLFMGFEESKWQNWQRALTPKQVKW